jgi:hypothetical protein
MKAFTCHSFPTSSRKRIETITQRRRAFTILEVLIALTAALLLMLGLARAYKFLGDKITERQSELDLSSRLRDVALRLRDELLRATSEMNPPAKTSASEGYLVYHEGPFTDSTTILGSVPHPTPSDVTYFPDSRIGDIDDFLAFTSRAKEGAPFVGFIPRGVLYARRLADGQMTTAEIGSYTAASASELVPFYSDVAEIAYWLSPQWERTRTGNEAGALVYDTSNPDGGGNTSLYPIYRDRNGDLLPDRLRLHRRVLLVRPDLNMTPAEMNAVNVANGSSGPTTTPETRHVPVIPFLVPDGSGNAQIVPLSRLDGLSDAYTGNTPFVPGLWLNSGDPSQQNTAAPHWLTGIARLQQIMDLSISRVTDRWTQPGTFPFGMPTALTKANSLAELSRPENRFAHVRIPQQVISGDTAGSSMPQIALCPPHPYLTARFSSPPNLPDPNDPLLTDTPVTFPEQANHVVGNAPGDAPYLGQYGRFTMTTFLRPEFNLADRVSTVGAGNPPFATVSTNRGGTDVIADNLVAFDIQVFDPSAPRFVWSGDDGQPGIAGVNDDGVGATDNLTELGWPQTDDEVVPVNSPRINEAYINNGNRTQADWFITPATEFRVVDQGDFVDLGYMRLAGGPMRGLVQFDESGTVIAQPPVNQASIVQRHRDFASPFSGFDVTSNVGVTTGSIANITTLNPGSLFPTSWEQSGRFIVSQPGGLSSLSSFYQPVYDTWTDSYSTDPYDQEGALYGAFLNSNGIAGSEFGIEVGGVNSVPFYTEQRVAQDNSSTVSSAGRAVAIRRWTSADGGQANQGAFSDQNAGKGGIPANASDTPIRVTPPVPEPLRALKVSIRVFDVEASTIRQQTVIQEF